ncbi:hypothetical protein NC652_029523 [Populus alba x Populus x berolinensis]|nr:hypothetical protein NC652_029523 [Populus alba x Populus x berolinensis]
MTSSPFFSLSIIPSNHCSTLCEKETGSQDKPTILSSVDVSSNQVSPRRNKHQQLISSLQLRHHRHHVES